MGLKALLASERAICRQLLALAAQEHAALVAGDTLALQRIVARQEATTARWAALERQRFALLEPWAALLELPEEQVTLEAVLPHLPDAEARAVAGLQGTLRDELAALQRAKAANRTVLERALESVTTLLDLVRGVHATPARYARSGVVASTVPLAVLDRRV